MNCGLNMWRFITLLLFGFLAAGPHALAQTPSPTPQGDRSATTEENEVIRIDTNLVTVPVRVLNRDGKYIPDLQRHDFRLFEDGVEQQIVYFEPVEAPITVILLLDTSDSTRFHLEEIQNAAIAFINQLRSGDRVLVISFNEQIKTLSEVTNDREALRQAVRRAQTGGGTRVYDAVNQAIKQRVNHLRGRKVLVLFSDGVDTSSGRATYESTLRDIDEADAQIYAVYYDTYIDLPVGNNRFRVTPGVGSSLKDHQKGQKYLQEMARRTGSRLFTASNVRHLTQAFAEIAKELRWQYSLGYYPSTTSTQSAQPRQIRLSVNRPRVIVRARSSYILQSPSKTTTQE